MDGICWQKVNDGDKAEIENVVHKYYKIGYIIAHKWARTGQIEESEAIGLSHIALMKCITKCTYDETKNIKFSAYFGAAVHNEIGMFLRKDKRRKARTSYSLDQPLHGGSQDDDNLTYSDIMIEPSTIETTLEDKFLLDAAQQIFNSTIRQMTAFEAKVMILHLAGLSLQQLSDELDVSVSTVRHILIRAKTKLRDTYKAQGDC